MICAKYGCDYQLDLDGQVTCTQCGAMDDEKPSPTIQAIEKELTPLSKSQVRRITKVKSDELRDEKMKFGINPGKC